VPIQWYVSSKTAPKAPLLSHISGCKVNLWRYKDDADTQDHLDEHLALGESLPQAIAHFPTAQVFLPPPTRGEIPGFVHLRPFVSAPRFSSSALARAKQHATHSQAEEDALLFGTCIRHEWLEAEEEEAPAETKERKIGNLHTIGRVQPTREHPKLSTPPKLLSAAPPRHPTVSVGFHSQRFHEQAKAAFEKVAEEMEADVDSKYDEPMY
jgi:hypothetical protein